MIIIIITYSWVWINWVWLLILLVVSWIGKIHIPLSLFAPESLVSRDGFGRPVPRQPSHIILGLNLVLTHGIPPDFCGVVHLFLSPIAIKTVPSLSGHAIAYRWRSLQRVRRHRASSPQGSSSNGCCLFRYHREPNNLRPSFSNTCFVWFRLYFVWLHLCCDHGWICTGSVIGVELHTLRNVR